MHLLPFAIERYYSCSKSSLSGLLGLGSQFRTLYKFGGGGGGRRLLDRLRKERELDLFRRKIITIPNILTLSRLSAAPLFPYFITNNRPSYAFGLLLYCGITDMLDGWIARRFNQKSALGSILDPVADKVTVVVFTTSLLMHGNIPVYLAGLFVSKDLFLLASGLVLRFRLLKRDGVPLTQFFNPAVSSVEVKPLLISKLNTALQFVTLGLSVFGADSIPYLDLLQVTASASTFITGFCHIFQYRNVFKRIRIP